MKQNNRTRQEMKGQRIVVEVERPRGYGSVPGLDDEELADPEELERWVMLEQWGPILALPTPVRSGFHPSRDEFGNLDGAFGSVDFERLYGRFDKARYKAGKLREQLRYTLIMLEMVMQRLPGRSKFMVLRLLRTNVIDLDHIDDERMHAIARWYLRSIRLREEIQQLRERSCRRQAEE